ncbi:MotA/TolQ/ExbB proton channel family protein [bacterium]|nr:MotA/TolQ/ExbB proton channel family protein [bacterium]MCP5462482.1 MotA/TolQ/ExbB proton channel family protein [bacterium]
MNHPLFNAFFESGFVSQGIMIILLLLSISAWTIIIEKFILFKKLKDDGTKFLAYFHLHLSQNAEKIAQHGDDSLLKKLYINGIKEYAQFRKTSQIPIQTTHIRDIENSLKRTIAQESQRLGKNMIILATSANASPLLGLLGTVYGLLIAFNEMGIMGSASIEVVSPGISQALVTTVLGLFVAIPSAVGYNYLLNTIKNLLLDMENFMSEFLSLIEKGLFE